MDLSITPIDGINEKLKRAHENIVNLEAEIERFLQENEYPILGNENFQVIIERAQRFQKLPIPLRFSVLAGEVLQHLRSTLDHMAWLLVGPEWRNEKAKAIRVAFPIFCLPFDKNGTASLKGKIESFPSPEVRDFIGRIQPYNRPDPLNDPLWLIHDLDIKAKHRELPLAMSGFDMGSPQLNAAALFYATHDEAPLPQNLAMQFKQDIVFSPVILFADFCNGQPEAMIPALSRLEAAVRNILDGLMGDLARC